MKNLAKLWTAIVAMMVCVACISCEESGTIKGYDREMLDIVTYANDTDVKGGFSFTAEEAWSTAIDYGNDVRSSEGWITLDPASGGAGKVTITITLDENLTGVDRTATISIICGETTLTIEVIQKGSENPGNDDGTQDNDSTGNGNDPSQKIDEYAIGRIIQSIDESGMQKIYTYTFAREGDDPRGTIRSVLLEGLPREDGAATVYDRSVEYVIERDFEKLYVTAYVDGIAYETIEACHNGRYIDNVTYVRDIEMSHVSGGEMSDPIQGISKETFYFHRKSFNDHLYRTDYVDESIFEGNEQYNNTNEITYNMVWQEVEEPLYDIFHNPYNQTQISWVRHETDENHEYMTYNTELNVMHLLGTRRPIESPGSFIDINHLIATFWFEGANSAYGECNGILGLLGWVSAPSYNMISKLSYLYGEYRGNECHVSYELNENQLISRIVAGNDYSSTSFDIEYIVY